MTEIEAARGTTTGEKLQENLMEIAVNVIKKVFIFYWYVLCLTLR